MIKFFKYHGLGNDFIIIDDRADAICLDKKTIIAMCNRFFGIGADGVVFVKKSRIAPVKMLIYNSDGTLASMCGNASRCFAKFVFEKGIIDKNTFDIETGAGIITPILKVDKDKVISITINMGIPIFESNKIPCSIKKDSIINEGIIVDSKKYEITSLLMGVAHTVLFTDNIEDDYVVNVGRKIETTSIFPERTNVNFVKIQNEKEITVRTWERGAGYTYACGTGACASVVSGIACGYLMDEVTVHLRGGDLNISWNNRGNVFMEGQACEVYEGIIDIDKLELFAIDSKII